MTIKEACKIAGIRIDELIDEASEYFELKLSNKKYAAYRDNPGAKEKLWQDCLQNTLWSKASLNNKLKNLVLAEGKNDKKVYLCKTLEDAQDFLYQCIEKDILVWRSACWDIYKENTCYNIEDKRAYYSDRHYYEELRFDIIEYHKGDKF